MKLAHVKKSSDSLTLSRKYAIVTKLILSSSIFMESFSKKLLGFKLQTLYLEQIEAVNNNILLLFYLNFSYVNQNSTPKISVVKF